MNYPKKIIYKDTNYYLQSSGRYYSSNKKINGERLLHRRVWVDYKGTIPEKHVIHHIDGDFTNNDISNLACVDKLTHGREHMKKRFQCVKYRELNKKQLLEANKKASAWHRSPEGLKQHARQGYVQWAKNQEDAEALLAELT